MSAKWKRHTDSFPTMVACAPWGAAGEFAASHHGALTRRQAADNGISRKALQRLLRDRVLEEPLPGVLRVVGSAPTWRQSLYIVTLAGNEAGAGAFRSSSALHGMDGYEPGPLELLMPSRRRLAIEGVIVHEGPMGSEHVADFTVVDGIRCTGVARTLCDLGSVDSPERVKVAFEWAWRNGFSLTWLRQTAERFHRPGQRGTGVLLDLLDKVDVRARPTESVLEVRLEGVIGHIPGLAVSSRCSIATVASSPVSISPFRPTRSPSRRTAGDTTSVPMHRSPTVDERRRCRPRDGSCVT
jgi:hypothetical protein